VPEARAAFVPLVSLPVLDEPEGASLAFDEAGHGDDSPAGHLAANRLPTETGKRNQAENNPPTARFGITKKPGKMALGWPWNSLLALKQLRRLIVIQCHTPAPSGRHNRAFLRLFSMIWPVPTKTRVRFPSPDPIFP
jgi:hypothetical protein